MEKQLAMALLPRWPEEYSIHQYLASLPDAEFTGLGSESAARIAAWSLTSGMLPVQCEGIEGIVTCTPRHVVDRELIRQGKEYSGVFTITSHFKGGKRSFKKTGTAFAVNKFHVLTSAHLMFDLKLGPAKSAFLLPDERQGRYWDRGMPCVAVACHANHIKIPEQKGRRAENDFCMLAVADAFNSGVRIFKCHNEPSSFDYKDGLIVGFPKDMPDNSPGKHLISSKGSMCCSEKDDVLSINHMINTEEGNSGSPIIINNLVVGVHSRFLAAKGCNAAAPVNRNGNRIDDFSAALCYMRGQPAEFHQGGRVLESARGVTHPGDVLTLFT
ncbi:hypothetical protein RRF57_005960 [Xylaria bambusicola]|uniref:Peptidase S1 domain-containing protein n=1 Tax=Xylaria bambusicola TaxID=326684 RepID=A0AAN7UPK8_9PEZI